MSGLWHRDKRPWYPVRRWVAWMLLRDHLGDLSGKHAVVIGRLTSSESRWHSCFCEQLHCDDRSFAQCRPAGAVPPSRHSDRGRGAARNGQGQLVKPGATVIDVGINRVTSIEGKSRLVGRCRFRRRFAGRGSPDASSRRRGADDHRLLARKHAECLPPITRPARAGRTDALETQPDWSIR